jgi:hypothetical protein
MPLKRIRPVAVAVAVAALLWHAPARADVKQACVDASTEGQALRDAAKLQEARNRFVACARDACPSIVRKYCAEWLADIERRLPSAVFHVQSADGADVLGARLVIDGHPQQHGLDGTAIELDPGEHAVRIEREGGEAIEQRLVIVEGERGRVITVRASAPPRAPAASVPAVEEHPAPARASRFTPLTFTFAGVGLVGLAGFTYFGLTAQGDLSHLRETCAPSCTSSQLDSVKREALFADVSLGLGVVAVGLAVYTLVAHRAPAAATTAHLDLKPAPGGAVVVLGGRF